MSAFLNSQKSQREVNAKTSADDDEEEFVDESGFLSDLEIDEVNKRIPELVAVEDPVEEDSNESEPVEDQSASASGG